MSKMTDWYGKDQKPLKSRIGFYRTRFMSGGEGFSYWNGRRFGSQGYTVENARRLYEQYGIWDAVQEKEWCGLAQNPHAK